jgi:lysyl-tRNA synthetase class 2
MGDEGRVRSVRVAGKGLVFIDIVEDSHKVQVMCNSKAMEVIDGVSKDQFKDFYRLLRRGDIICESSHNLRNQ